MKKRNEPDPTQLAKRLKKAQRMREKDEWDEHDYSREDWMNDVNNGNTQLGYWTWVELKIFEELVEEANS